MKSIQSNVGSTNH